MIIRALIYSLGVFALTAVISLAVAGIIRLLYLSVNRREIKKEEKKAEAKPVT